MSVQSTNFSTSADQKILLNNPTILKYSDKMPHLVRIWLQTNSINFSNEHIICIYNFVYSQIEKLVTIATDLNTQTQFSMKYCIYITMTLTHYNA